MTIQPHSLGASHAIDAQNAAEVFAALLGSDVRILAYKEARLFERGLEGDGDLDLLLHPGDLQRMRGVFRAAGGFRGIVSRWHDNAIPEREDWFVPVSGRRLLQFDIAQAIMAGPKFAKSTRGLEFDQLAPGGTISSTAGVPVAEPIARVCIALVRAAFAGSVRERAKHLLLDPALADALRSRAASSDATMTVPVPVAQTQCEIALHLEGNALVPAPDALPRLRDAIAKSSATGATDRARQIMIHTGRRLIAGFLRRIPPRLVRHPLDKRKLTTGAIVALVGPDGVGKSTKAAMLQAAFARRFLTARLYLGSNDGGWMAWRRKLRRKPGRRGPSQQVARDRAKPAPERRWMHATGSAGWRLVVGIRRLLLIRQAERLARRGVLVITDRWPQDLAEGMLDGPSRSPAERFRLARLMWRVEKRLYRAMAGHRPTLTIHLEAPFEVSHARKPGDIDRPDFERRVQFMRKLRDSNGEIAVVDAAMPLEEVAERLFRLTCQHVSKT